MEYTKGPWRENHLGEIENAEGERVAASCITPGVIFLNRADLHLSLAAPDMYEALVGIAQILLITEYPPETRLDLIRSSIKQALAKAEGRE